MCNPGRDLNEGVCPHGGCPHETYPGRRTFLKIVVGWLTAPIVILLGWPFAQSIIGTVFRLPKATFEKVGSMGSFPENQPISPKYESRVHEAYIHTEELRDVWVIKHSETELTVFSPICPHLGCRYDWYSEAKKFICPCHGSVFSIEGKVLGGPAPRGLDTLPWKIENGDLHVKWERFRVGIAKKVRIG